MAASGALAARAGLKDSAGLKDLPDDDGVWDAAAHYLAAMCANLVLTEGDDVLEAGVEIMASPPGKKLKSISLLSGGEQTMTAVALLFALYQVKPSPFCVLDELDAPLDDANTERYVSKLKEFLTHSQFIVITHSKRTIAAADVLYGVTMQERGVSRLVSVKFSAESSESTDRMASATKPADPAENEEVFLAK